MLLGKSINVHSTPVDIDEDQTHTDRSPTPISQLYQNSSYVYAQYYS